MSEGYRRQRVAIINIYDMSFSVLKSPILTQEVFQDTLCRGLILVGTLFSELVLFLWCASPDKDSRLGRRG